MNTVAAIIQSRMRSTRTPGKALRPLAGIPMTEHIIKRLQQVTEFDRIVLAVPDSPSEEPLVRLAQDTGIDLVQGPEDDVLQRFILAGDRTGADHILRVCGDNPLIDLNLARSLIRRHLETNADYTHPEGMIPEGTATELVKLSVLKGIAKTTSLNVYREHVITYIHAHRKSFKIEKVPAPEYLLNRNYRLTLDTEQDFLLMEKIYDHFYSTLHPILDLAQILPFLDTHPEYARLNADVIQKNWRNKIP